MINRLIALIIVFLTIPLLLITAFIILFDDGLPVFFIQKRIGKDNTHFWIYKFRTMKKKTPDIPTHMVKSSNDFYTRTGPLIRKYSLDEIPQLLNVLRGDLVLIGPRPALYNQKDLIDLRTKKGIHKLTPGITGWAQVNGRDELSIEDKVKHDYFYLKNKSFLLDIKIIFNTIIKIFRAEGVSIK